MHHLLLARADPNAQTVRARTPLHVAAEACHAPAVQKLLQAGATQSPRDPLGLTPLHLAASRGGAAACKALVAASARVNARTRMLDEGRWTPLHLACSHGHVEAAEALVEAGAEVNAGHHGVTPAHRAATAGHADILRMLLSNHADVNQREKTTNRRTPLHVAIDEGHVDAAMVLLHSGHADVHLVNYKRECALHLAAQLLANSAVHAAMQEAGATATEADVGKVVPVAAAHELVMALLDRGAKPTMRDGENATPLHVLTRCATSGTTAAMHVAPTTPSQPQQQQQQQYGERKP